ncbi:hypothetical protein GGI42DRAFT_313141 [Trichoderma sp. SZMC 28013]
MMKTLGDAETSSPASVPQYIQLAAEVIEAMGAWDAYESYAAQPSVEGLNRHPRSVRLTLQLDGASQSNHPLRAGY